MRYRTPLILILCVVVLWSAGWYALMWEAERRITQSLAELAGRGFVVLCPNREIGGFPLSFEISCARLTLRDARAGTRMTSAAGAVEASLLHPASLVVDLGSPTAFRAAPSSETITMSWSDAKLAAGFGLGGPNSARTQIEGGGAAWSGGAVAYDDLTAELAPSEGGSLLGFRAGNLTVETEGSRTAPTTLSLNAHLSVPPAGLAAGLGLPAGLSAEDLRIGATSGELALTAEGDLAVDSDGLLNGTLLVRLSGLGALPAFVATLPERAQPLANSAAGALMAFGRAMTIDGKDAREIELTIAAGELRLGYVSLGRIPPL